MQRGPLGLRAKEVEVLRQLPVRFLQRLPLLRLLLLILLLILVMGRLIWDPWPSAPARG